ncbi:MAG: TFIIB-type zinc ribbon-containing protein, partial [Vulcanisaeta sp.]
MQCPYCGSLRIVEKDGQYVCVNCGTVIGSVYVYDTYTQSSPLIDGEEIDLTPIWKSVERSVRRSGEVRLSIYKRLRAINELFRVRRESYSMY